ncbi:glycoside hydrolase family 2 TIM barrel-domain containing protein [Candidatus Soleaferrea massiliensis]|uniref:glycoside hydrolase family 2 TIM barrel-domain containing protein n=1 Tax=Candidatus Soleaferrea massiliensis TaxID=1470354 RepID=UPI0006948E5E|nr:glycoside hydrolase family 2 TIM barrel-domain containing protein [Candidatus Soleaferrea massiliensis]
MFKKALAATMATAIAVTSLSLGAFVNAADAQFKGEEWYDDIETVGLNVEPARSYFIPYQDEASALTRNVENSKFYQLLNGEWDFKLVEKPADRILGFEADDYDYSDWDKITVPSSWQTQGFFDQPLYINTRYPWCNYESVSINQKYLTAPTVYNPVGHYRTEFEVPADWDGRETFISFQGVESAYYVYVNGRQVGYSEDSYTAHEFNITDYLKKGEKNTLAVQVYRWSTGSYLENQDFIRLSGIFRDVFLYSKDEVELRDYFIKTDLDENYVNSDLIIEADVRNNGAELAEGYKVVGNLYDADGNLVKGNIEIAADSVAAGETERFTTTVEIENPEKWYDDNPYLYKLSLQLVNAEGKTIEAECQRVGFREIENKPIGENGQFMMTINGQRLVLRGTNRHETDPETGRALSKERIEEDVKLLKQFNTNAVRMSHYPEDPYFYEMCDEYGLYLMDEANIESHQGATQGGQYHIPAGPGRGNQFQNAVMSRTQSMVERDKNHPSVVMWSLGNEAVYSLPTKNDNYLFYQSTKWILHRDPTRLRACERDNRVGDNNYSTGNYDAAGAYDYNDFASREKAMVDVFSTQYISAGSAAGYANNKNIKIPFVHSEYAHAMGQAMGNYREYWDEVRNNPRAQGGFIWDMVDQSIYVPEHSVTTYYPEDKSSYQNKVTLEGTIEDGRNGDQAMNGKITVPNSSAVNLTGNAITLDAWIKPQMTSTHGTIIGKGDNQYCLALRPTQTSAANPEGVIDFALYSGGWYELLVKMPTDMYNGEWHHLAATYDGSKMKLFYDGAVIGEMAMTRNIASSNIDVGVGYCAQYGRQFKGLIGSAKIFDRALTLEELQNDSVQSTDPSARLWIDFNNVKSETQVVPQYFGYGGDWGETETDNDFCANGWFSADRTPQPEAYEVKKAHQQIYYTDSDVANGVINVSNEMLSTNTNAFNHTWKLVKDGKVIEEGTYTPDVAAMSNKDVTIPFTRPENIKPEDEYFLEVSATLKEDTNYANAGHEVAREQFAVDFGAEGQKPTVDPSQMPNFSSIDNGDNALQVAGENFSLTFDKTAGTITDYKVGGKTVLTEGPKPNYYRGPISNGNGNGSGMSNSMTVSNVQVDQKDKVITVSFDGTVASGSNVKMTYVIFPSGDVQVKHTLTTTTTDLCQVGMSMQLSKDYENIQYYGRGPLDNYVDRKWSTDVGIYDNTVEGMFYDKFVKPQDSGNRSDVRWAALTDDDGNGVMFSSETPMFFGASHYRWQDLNNRHLYQCEKTEDVVLNIASKQRGLGNGSCGPGPLGKYTFGNGTFTQVYRITPITADTDKMTESKKTVTVDPLLDITVNGVSIGGFNSDVTAYNYPILKDTVKDVPTVDVVKVNDSAEVEVTQADSMNGTATIKAVSGFGVEKTYTVQFSETEQAYVSDLPWSTDIPGYFPNRRDIRPDGGGKIQLVVDGQAKTFEKGVGAHAPAKVGINIEGKGYQYFETYVGINYNQTSANASVTFRILADGKEIWASSEKKAREEATYIKVPVDGYKEIVLYADMGDNDGNDHSVWADAKFTSAPLSGNESLNIQNGMIMNPPETAKELKDAYEGQNVVVLDKDGNALADDAALFTGAIVKFANAGEYAPYHEVVVKGDVLGEGKSSVTGLLAIKSHILGRASLEGAYEAAADYNSDGLVNIFDLVAIKMAILKG